MKKNMTKIIYLNFITRKIIQIKINGASKQMIMTKSKFREENNIEL